MTPAQPAPAARPAPAPRSTPQPAPAALPPVPAIRPATLTGLAALLRASAPFDSEAAPLWDADAEAALTRSNAAPALAQLQARRRTGERTAAEAVVASAFILDQPVAEAEVVAACGTDLTAALISDGWLVPADTGTASADTGTASAVTSAASADTPWLRAALTITAYEDLLIASDFGTLTRPEPLAGDFVLGLGGAGRTLAGLTPRTSVDLACDIGTGCGIQALLLAGHAARVIATDISTRALAVAKLNAALNDIDSIEFRHGDMLAPIDEPVDLLVANPPFVITPQGETESFEYRDGGRSGDAIMTELITGIPDLLRDDGHAVILGNWEYRETETTEASVPPPVRWLEDAGSADPANAARTSTADPANAARTSTAADHPAARTSLLLIERERLDPVAYAETWIRDGGVPRMSERWLTDTAAWLADFRARGVASVGFGWIRMHRSPTPRERVLRASQETGPVGDLAAVAGVLDTRLAVLEWLAGTDDGTDDAALAAMRFVRGHDLVEHRHHLPGEDQPHTITYEQGTGFGRTITADTALAGFLGVCDGQLSLGQIAAALADLLDVDAAALLAQLTGQVRALLADGFLFPVLEAGAEHPD